jgi:hypothetical protein
MEEPLSNASDKLHSRCGILTLRYTLVAPGFCPFCLGDEGKEADERFQQWLVKSTLLNHIDNHFDALKASTTFICPHPRCQGRNYHDSLGLRRHFFDAHSIEEPRSNCIKRKRKWQEEPDLELETQAPGIAVSLQIPKKILHQKTTIV